MLNTVYYLSQPVENVPYDFYLDFLSKEEVVDLVAKGIHSEEEVDALIERRRAKLTRGQARDLAEMSPEEQRDYLLDGRFSRMLRARIPTWRFPFCWGLLQAISRRWHVNQII